MTEITIKDFLDAITGLKGEVSGLKATLAAMTLELTSLRQEVARLGGTPTTPPIVIPPTQPPPSQTKKGWGVNQNTRKFTKDGIDVPFVKGANCRPLAYHIKTTPQGEFVHILPGDDIAYFTSLAHIQDVDDTIERARAMGCDAMRIYAPIRTHQNGMWGTNIQYCIDRVSEAVRYIANRGMATLLVLNCTSSPFNVHPAPSNIQWYKTGYKKEYLDFVNAVVDAFRDNENIFGFEVMNEPHSYQPFGVNEAEIMLAFMGDMASRIKAIAPNRLVLPGNETSHQLFSHQKVNYFQRYLDTAFDALSLHLYSPTLNEPLGAGTKLGDNANLAANYELAQTKKLVYAGEIGIFRQGHSLNAAEPTRKLLALLKSLGVAGAFQWGLVEARQEGGNIGWHDGTSMDNCEHTHDFLHLFDVWANFN